MGAVKEDDVHEGSKKKSKKRKNKESVTSNEEDNVQVGAKDSRKKKTELLDNVNSSEVVGDPNSDSGKSRKKQKILQDESKIDENGQENDHKKHKKKEKEKTRDEGGTSSERQTKKKEKTHVKETKVVDRPALKDQNNKTVLETEGGVVSDFEQGVEEQSREDGSVKKKKKNRKNVLEIQPDSEVIEKVDAMEDKKKKKKKRKEGDDSGSVVINERNTSVGIDDNGEDKKKKSKKGDDSGSLVINERNTSGGVDDNGEDKKKKGKEGDDSASLVISERNTSVGVDDNGDDKKNKKKNRKKSHNSGSLVISERNTSVHIDDNGVDKKKKKKTKKDDLKTGSMVKEIVNNKTKSNEVAEPSDRSKSHKQKKKVTFSNQNEYFPPPDSSIKIKKKTRGLCEGQISSEDGLIRGKRFSKEEDALVEKAVLDYIEDHQLGDNGIEMIMKCKSNREVRDCWKEIGSALPHRPNISVYYRAHILFERGDSRKWTEEELDLVKKFHEKHGADWKTLADELGKHRFHVKDAWRRIRLPNLRKGNWSQDEYQNLFDLVNLDLSMKAFQEKKSKHGMLRDNISWEAISEKLATRSNSMCCDKWYYQLASPMVSEGKWVDTDDYRLLMALTELDAVCEEDVDWDNLLEHRPGDVCRKRWDQMVRHIGYNGVKPFVEQVEILSQRYCPDVLEAKVEYDNKPAVD